MIAVAARRERPSCAMHACLAAALSRGESKGYKQLTQMKVCEYREESKLERERELCFAGLQMFSVASFLIFFFFFFFLFYMYPFFECRSRNECSADITYPAFASYRFVLHGLGLIGSLNFVLLRLTQI